MPKVSVIIPVYNSSKYLPDCLESIFAQTLEDLEIICINDGSTDNSLSILKEFQQKDSRILIIDQENRGVSEARNAGLEKANGNYIGFVDSDDSIQADFFRKLHDAAQFHGAEIVFTRDFNETNVLGFNRNYSKGEIRKVILPLYFREDSYNSVCNKLYSATIISKQAIKFSIGKTHGEDAEFNINLLVHVKQLYVLDYSGYHYRETEGSATRNVYSSDYLGNAVETFKKDWTTVIGNLVDPETMARFKKERFIKNIISQVYINAVPGNGLSLSGRFRKLFALVSHSLVHQLFTEENEEITRIFSRYQKEIYLGIQRKSVIKLYLLSLYSYYRSK